MDLRIEIKSNYGKEAIYPACSKASKFCQLLGQATLTRLNLKTIKELGYNVIPISPKL